LSATVTWLALGCSKNDDRVPVFPVSGKVTFKGDVPNGAFVVFHPRTANAKAFKPSGQVKEDGTFQLTTYDGNDGAPAGEYDVTIQWNKLVQKGADVTAGPNVIPGAYAKPDTSPLKNIKIAEGPNTLGPFTITE
jgi:hypothetical protein